MEVLESCPLCGGGGVSDHHRSLDNLVSKQLFGVSLCHACGFLFTNPRPDAQAMGKYYCSDDYISHTDGGSSLFDKLYRRIRKFMIVKKYSVVEKHKTVNGAATLLDYGCGTGEFLKYCQYKGYNVMGYEPGNNASVMARNKSLQVLVDEPLLEQLEENQFQVITLWHVFEHIVDFQQKIDLFSRKLCDNGILIIAVPEHKSYDAKFYKEHWAAWDVPRHVNHFEEKTLTRAVFNSGFVLVKKYPLIFDSYYIALLSERKKNKIVRFLLACMVGFWSNIHGLLGKSPFSSQIYVFKKMKDS